MELTAGKVAVVTGAASGIGLALAERFARAGLDVVLADIEKPALVAAEQKVAGLGVKTLAVPTDVSDEAAVSALAAAAVDRFGTVHVVCNNAGVSTNADPWSGPISAWKWMLGVNLWGIIHGIRAFLPVLAAQREGHIVNTASAAGLIPAVGPTTRPSMRWFPFPKTSTGQRPGLVWESACCARAGCAPISPRPHATGRRAWARFRRPQRSLQ